MTPHMTPSEVPATLPRKTEKMSVYLTQDLKERMDRLRWVNWNQVIRYTIEKKLPAFEEPNP